MTHKSKYTQTHFHTYYQTYWIFPTISSSLSWRTWTTSKLLGDEGRKWMLNGNKSEGIAYGFEGLGYQLWLTHIQQSNKVNQGQDSYLKYASAVPLFLAVQSQSPPRLKSIRHQNKFWQRTYTDDRVVLIFHNANSCTPFSLSGAEVDVTLTRVLHRHAKCHCWRFTCEHLPELDQAQWHFVHT